jgi:hypothetical protein
MTDGTVGTPKSSASLNNKNWNSMNMFKIYTACSIANSSCIRFFFSKQTNWVWLFQNLEKNIVKIGIYMLHSYNKKYMIQSLYRKSNVGG